MYCKKCGKVLSIEDKFCSGCGTKIVIDPIGTSEANPLFFKGESPSVQEKPRRVIHLEDFNWDLDGYPTAPRKTEDVDFDWHSVLEQKVKVESPKIEKEEIYTATRQEWEQPESMDRNEQIGEGQTVSDPEEENEQGLDQVVIHKTEDPVEKETPQPIKELEELFQNIGTTPIEEPTKLIDRNQMKVDNMEKLYVFDKRQEEFQVLLDREYERIQSGMIEKEDHISIEEDGDAKVDKAIPQLVSIVWSQPPKGFVVEERDNSEDEGIILQQQEILESMGAEVKEQEAENQGAESQDCESADKTIIMEDVPQPKEDPVTEETTECSEITFADIFKEDEDEDEKTEKGSKVLKVIAIILCILVVIELCILGIQKWAPDSKAAQLINQAYNGIETWFTGTDDVIDQQEVAGPSELEEIITAQSEKNENIVVIEEDRRLLFEEGDDYGYEEFANTYAFRNSAWYDTEEGAAVTFGDEIVGTLIEYYSAYSDKVNDVNNDVLDFIDKNSQFYDEVDGMSGSDDAAYMIDLLKIGEVRTGSSGFYVLTQLSIRDKENPDGRRETKIVYLEPDTGLKNMQIVDVKEV